MQAHLEMEDLQAKFVEMGTSPQDQGILELIVRRPDIDQREIVGEASLDMTEGLIGDNWRARGSSSTPDGSANPESQITLMNSRIVQLLAQDKSRWPLAGDQLYVDFDISIDNLPPGQRIAIGTAILEISAKPHTGCKKFTERFGKDAILFVSSDEGKQARRRGVNARVVQPGTIRAGDLITKVAR